MRSHTHRCLPKRSYSLVFRASRTLRAFELHARARKVARRSRKIPARRTYRVDDSSLANNIAWASPFASHPGDGVDTSVGDGVRRRRTGQKCAASSAWPSVPSLLSLHQAASVHLARHSRPIEILSHSLATVALRGLPRALLYHKKRGDRKSKTSLRRLGVYTRTAVLSQTDSRRRLLRLTRVVLCPRARSYVFTWRMFSTRRFGASCSIPARLKFNAGSRTSRYNTLFYLKRNVDTGKRTLAWRSKATLLLLTLRRTV